jgi:hypothetical protein
MREEVKALLALGPFPAEDACTVEAVDRHEQAYRAITRPLTDEEAAELARLFGPDGYFGLASSLVHLLETAPSWPLREAITHAHPLWAEELRMRCVRGGVW